MDDACHMHDRESVSELRAQPENILLVGGASRHAVAQRDALNVLRHEEVDTVLRVEVVDRLNVRVIQRGERQRFFSKTAARRLVGQHLG